MFHGVSHSSKDMSTLLQDSASRFTTFGRTYSPFSPDPIYAPTITALVSTIVVHRAWLSCALILQCAGLIFLLLTILSTKWLHTHPGHRTRSDHCIGGIRVRLEFHGSNGLDLVDPGVVYLLDLQSGAGDIFHVYYSFFDSQYENFPSSYTAIRM